MHNRSRIKRPTGKVKYQTLKQVEAEWASSHHSVIGARLIQRYYILGRAADPMWAPVIRDIIQHITRQCINDSGSFSDDDVLIRLVLFEVFSASIPVDAGLKDMAAQKKSVLFKQDPSLEKDFEDLLEFDVPFFCEEIMGL